MLNTHTHSHTHTHVHTQVNRQQAALHDMRERELTEALRKAERQREDEFARATGAAAEGETGAASI